MTENDQEQTRRARELYKEHRDYLSREYHSTHEFLDKTTVYISSGAFALAATLIQVTAASGSRYEKWLLVATLSAFGLGIVSCLISATCSLKNTLQQRQLLDEQVSKQSSEPAVSFNRVSSGVMAKTSQRLCWCIKFFEFLSVSMLILGILAFVVFAWVSMLGT